MKHSRNELVDEPAASVFPDVVPAVASERLRAPDSAELDARLRAGASSTAGRRMELPDTTAVQGHLRATTLTVKNMHQFGDLYVNFLEARKRTFIDRLHWSLPQVDGMEFDQYDTPQASWVAIHEYGEVLGGVRLMPTTSRCGIYTYMLRDAQRGILHDIPTDVLFFEAPVDPSVWEASRLFISDDVPAHRRLYVQTMLMAQFSKTACEGGATHVIGIVPAVWSRWLRRLDLDAVPVGPKFSIDGTSSQAALFNARKFSN
ncbi:MAG: acyl-homoserine-lactone synthase [Paracoccaceae bacterium]